MVFEVSGVNVSPWVPPLVAFIISAFTSTGGVSGAFLLLPFQVSVLGFTSPAVSATNQLFNIVATPGGIIRYIKEGRMVWPLTWLVIAGTLPGVFIGAWMRLNFLPDPLRFKIFAGCLLLYLGLRLVKDVLRKKGKANNNAEQKFQSLVKQYKDSNKNNKNIVLPKAQVLEFNLKRLVYEFYGDTFSVPTIKIMIISLIVGIAGGAYGIGGGAIIAPIYVAFFGLPVYTVAGPALMGTFFTSVVAVIFYQVLAPFYPTLGVSPDWLLGFLFGLGGLAGIYTGARMQKYLPAMIIKSILCVIIVFIAVYYISAIF